MMERRTPPQAVQGLQGQEAGTSMNDYTKNRTFIDSGRDIRGDLYYTAFTEHAEDITPVFEALGGTEFDSPKLVFADGRSGKTAVTDPTLYAYTTNSCDIDICDLFEPRAGVIEIVFRDYMTGRKRVIFSDRSTLYLPKKEAGQEYTLAGMFGKSTRTCYQD